MIIILFLINGIYKKLRNLNQKKFTPLEIAKSQKATGMIQLLESKGAGKKTSFFSFFSFFQ